MVIQLPEKVQFIISRLEENGQEAYAVGGCVRDVLLNRIPQDWDITTSAKPEQVKQLFERTIDTGIAHGTVTVMLDKEGYEVTTYRIDGEYEDARHPKKVTYTANLLEDLKRRDFTINAMAYNPAHGLVDVFAGAEDLKNGIIRCVGEPEERFEEDALRMLRALRFAAQLGFTVEKHTREAVIHLARNLEKVSAERIQTELVKLLVSDHPDEMRALHETGISKVILPEWDAMMQTAQNNPHHCYTVGEHTIKALEQIQADRTLRLAMLFHDVAKPVCRTTDKWGIDHFYGHPQKGAQMTRIILRRLKFDNAAIDRVCGLVAGHDVNPKADEKSVRKAVRSIGTENFPMIFEVKFSDILAKSEYQRAEKLAALEQFKNCYRTITERGDCLKLKDLAVNGKDLIALGIEPGQQIGRILQSLLEVVIEEPEKNTKEYLTGYTLKNLFI